MLNRQLLDEALKQLPAGSTITLQESALVGLVRCCELLAEQLARKAQERSTPLIEAAKKVAIVAGALAGISFIFYGLGYVIVNLHLLSVGLRTFELTNPAYLPAGIAFFAAVILPLMLYLWVIWRLRPPPVPAVIGSVLLYPVWFIVFAVLLSNPTIQSFANIAQHGFVSTAVRLGQTSFWAVAAAVVAAGLLSALRLELGRTGEASQQQQSHVTTITAPVLLITLTILLLFALFSWAREIYPLNNPAVGGGRSLEVRLVLNPPKDTSLNVTTELGLQTAGNVTDKVNLLYEDEKTITVALSDGTALKLDKSLVAAIHYFPTTESQ